MKYKILAILCIGILLWFVIQPVEQNWCETDFLLIKAICIVSAVALLMLYLQKRQFTITTIDTVVLLWFGYVMIRAGVDTTYPCASFCLRTMQMLALYIGLRLILSSANISEKIIVWGILFCAFYEVIIGGIQLVNGTSRHNFYTLSGTFQNPGPYSAILSMGLVMSCQAKKPYWIPLIFAILLPATWSRAALLSAAICLAIIYWEQWKRWRWWVAAGALCVAAVFYFIKQGSADIIAKAGDKQMTCAVTVVKQVTSITLDKDNLTLLVGNTSTLTATILPDDATDKTVMWASCNLDVATVENGVVKGIGVGETTIIATSGSVSAICDVLVLSDSEPGVFAEYCGDSSVIVNDIVKAGSNLEFDLFNYSSETIHVVSAQLIDGQTGVGGDVTSLDSDIASGASDSWFVSVGESDMYLPIARFVYTFKGESYTCEAKIGSFTKAPRRYRNRP